MTLSEKFQQKVAEAQVYLSQKIEVAAAWTTELVRKVGVVGRSIVGFTTGLAMLITVFSADIASVAPEPYADDVAQVAAVVVAWLGTAAAAVRKVTPVPADEVGI